MACKASGGRSAHSGRSAARCSPAAAVPATKAAAPPQQSPQQPQQPQQQSGTHFASLYIKDFALVAEQRVEFTPGLNVITGESGSGKSVLVSGASQIYLVFWGRLCTAAEQRVGFGHGLEVVAGDARAGVLYEVYLHTCLVLQYHFRG